MTGPRTRPPPPAPSPGTREAGPARRWIGFALRSLRRRPWLAAAAWAGVVALALLALSALPLRYRVDAALLARRNPLMGMLSNPGLNREFDAPARAAQEAVLRRDNLLAIVRQVHLVDRYLERRAPAVRAWHRVRQAVTGKPLDRQELEDALVDTLTTRLLVYSDPAENTVHLSLEWTDRDLAYQLVNTAVQRFLDARKAQELSSVAEAVAVLEQQDAAVRVDLATAVAQYDEQERSLRAQAPPRGAAPRPRAPAAPPPDEAAGRLRAQLAAKQLALNGLEEQRRRDLADQELRLTQQLATYAPEHPVVVATRERIEELGQASPQMTELRTELDDLATELSRRGLRAEPPAVPAFTPQQTAALETRLRTTADEPALEYLRSELWRLLLKHTRLRGQIDAAQVELDAVQAAFAYRYVLAVPPELPRGPHRPKPVLVVIGALLGGLLFALFACVALDLSGGKVLEAWQVEAQLGLPVLGESSWATAAARPPRRWRIPARQALVLLLVGGVGLATGAAAFFGGTNPVLALLPVGLTSAAFLAARAPLRWSVAGLVLLLLVVELSMDTAGVWHTPLVALGDMLHNSLPGLKLSGLEAVVGFLLVVSLVRGRSGAGTDATTAARPTALLRDLVLLYLAGVAFAIANGLLHGGSPPPWKLRLLLHVPLLYLLFQRTLREERDLRLVGRVILVAACWRAALAVYIQRFVAIPLTGGRLAFATSHGDSILFTVAAVILVAGLLEDWGRASLLRALPPLLLILVGMVYNGRRLAWVMLAMSLVAAYLIGPRRPWKRGLTRGLVLSAPLLALYVAVGWNRATGIFSPLRKFRSVGDSSIDLSTLWREVENWNICLSIRQQPLLGVGLSGEYHEYIRNADISGFFAEYRQWPHNSVLGLLLLAGVFAFTAIWALHTVVVFLAARSYRLAWEPRHRVTALALISSVICCVVTAYGDTGPSFFQYRLFWALSLAMAGILAATTGAMARPRPVPRPEGP